MQESDKVVRTLIQNQDTPSYVLLCGDLSLCGRIVDEVTLILKEDAHQFVTNAFSTAPTILKLNLSVLLASGYHPVNRIVDLPPYARFRCTLHSGGALMIA